MKRPGEKRVHWPSPLDVLVGEDGRPPCPPEARCPVCRLFERPRPGETWQQWYERQSQDR